jgi:hypothetical protein
MERHPSTHQGKDEESLRDHILTVLASHFPQTTAETFNHLGKTDILIRQDGKNVFIGECKFWRGPKYHHDAIDQILGYLTWRDSKAAIIYFVRNKNLGPVLEEIDAATPDHRCYVETLGKTNDGWINFRLKLLEDSTSRTNLSILVFHFSE